MIIHDFFLGKEDEYITHMDTFLLSKTKEKRIVLLYIAAEQQIPPEKSVSHALSYRVPATRPIMIIPAPLNQKRTYTKNTLSLERQKLLALSVKPFRRQILPAVDARTRPQRCRTPRP